MRTLLFFDPAVSYNLVSPWMQPAFEIIDPIIAREGFTSLTMIMSRRQLGLAALWLDAIVLGMEKTMLQPVRIGLHRLGPSTPLSASDHMHHTPHRTKRSVALTNIDYSILQNLRAIRGLRFTLDSHLGTTRRY
jgi:hypothetical protein